MSERSPEKIQQQPCCAKEETGDGARAGPVSATECVRIALRLAPGIGDIPGRIVVTRIPVIKCR